MPATSSGEFDLFIGVLKREDDTLILLNESEIMRALEAKT
jgi:hypothetical protein